MNADEAGLGKKDIGKLLRKQAIPASVGILFMTSNLVVDTILVGQWVGPIAIAALAVVTPLVFFIASIGFSIGIGGSSVVSRALGANHHKKAKAAFAHQIMLTVLFTAIFCSAIIFFPEKALILFGAKGNITKPALEYLYPVIAVAPLQALASMANSVIRAEGKPRIAMTALMIASVGNIACDVLFIQVFQWGIFGAGLATAVSISASFLFVLIHFLRSELRPSLHDFVPNLKLTKEISALSFTTFARQSVITVLSALLNNTLFAHGGEHAVTVYGIISRVLMFALFPVNGITEGFQPVAGYNFGAKKYPRVRESVVVSIKYAGGLAIIIYTLILIFAHEIVSLFSRDAAVLRDAPTAMRWVFAASPVIALQLIGAAYFQASGQALRALMLTLTKQGFFLIPLILILPKYFGIFGIWVSFPIADVLATAVTAGFLAKAFRTTLKKR